jgi:predicted nucleic acid-binding protein
LKPIVSNATPLIYLAKIGRLTLLRDIFGEVLIPNEVKKEVVDRGKELGEKDAYHIDKAIQDGWIIVRPAEIVDTPIKLHQGEASTLSLAIRTGQSEVLIDEVSARTAARLMSLTPRGTVYVLLKALEMKLINLNEFLTALSDLTESGFRLKEEVYLEAIRKAREIDQRHT